MSSVEIIRNNFITVVVDPRNGGTIQHIGRDSNPKNNVLAWYEWRTPEALPLEYSEGQSATHWLSRYRGGWQFLTPNAGDECVFNGVRHSFHGESSYLPWRVLSNNGVSLVLEIVVLNTLRVVRELTISTSDASLSSHTRIVNLAPAPQEIVMVEHVAFQGSPTIEVDAPATSEWALDAMYQEDGRSRRFWKETGASDLSRPVVDRTERLAYLVSGNEGWISIFDNAKGFGAKIKWDPKVLPYLWYWQEQFSPGFPFYERAEMTALEPASCHPSDALAGASQAGRSTLLPARGEISFTIQVELI